MKKLILAIMVIVVTGAFEQRAAVTIKKRNSGAAAQVIIRLDSLGSKMDKLNKLNAKAKSDGKN